MSGEAGEGQLQKCIGKGVVSVSAPNETGWYEPEGYSDPDHWYVVDNEVMVPKKRVLKVLEDAKKTIPNIPDEDDPQFMFPDSYVPQIKAWLKEQFGS